MSLISEFRQKSLKKKSERLTKKLGDKKKEAVLAESVTQKQKEIDRLKQKIDKSSRAKQYLGAAGKQVKRVVENREKIGMISQQIGGNLLGQPGQSKKQTQKKKKQSTKKRKVFVYSPDLGGYVERR